MLPTHWTNMTQPVFIGNNLYVLNQSDPPVLPLVSLNKVMIEYISSSSLNSLFSFYLCQSITETILISFLLTDRLAKSTSVALLLPYWNHNNEAILKIMSFVQAERYRVGQKVFEETLKRYSDENNFYKVQTDECKYNTTNGTTSKLFKGPKMMRMFVNLVIDALTQRQWEHGSLPSAKKHDIQSDPLLTNCNLCQNVFIQSGWDHHDDHQWCPYHLMRIQKKEPNIIICNDWT